MSILSQLLLSGNLLQLHIWSNRCSSVLDSRQGLTQASKGLKPKIHQPCHVWGLCLFFLHSFKDLFRIVQKPKLKQHNILKPSCDSCTLQNEQHHLSFCLGQKAFKVQHGSIGPRSLTKYGLYWTIEIQSFLILRAFQIFQMNSSEQAGLLAEYTTATSRKGCSAFALLQSESEQCWSQNPCRRA